MLLFIMVCNQSNMLVNFMLAVAYVMIYILDLILKMPNYPTTTEMKRDGGEGCEVSACVCKDRLVVTVNFP